MNRDPRLLFPRLLPLLLLATAIPAPAAQAPAPTATSTPTLPAELSTIREAKLLAHASFLASDEMAGRYTGSLGQRAAARYVASRLESLGLHPLGDPGEDGEPTWYQSYPIVRRSLDPDRTHVTINPEAEADQESEPVTLRRPLLFFPREADESREISGRLVFCGLGRRGVRGGPDDFAGRDLEGHIAVLLQRPSRRAAGPVIAGNPVRDRARAAARAGAAGCIVLLVGEDPSLEVLTSLVGIHTEQAPVFRPAAQGMGRIVERSREMMAMGFAPPIPTAAVAGEGVATILSALGLDPAAVLAWAREDEPDQGTFGAGDRPEGTISYAIRIEDDHAVNVVGVLRGADPELSREAVVYSAHMDHVGVRFDGEIFNGADDNASGTSGLLEAARAFAAAPSPPRRSVVFLAVSGEEKGLWGSGHFAENPTWPLKDLVANVNIDMIGRSGPESGPEEITVTPTFRHRAFNTMVSEAHALAERLGISFTDGDKYFERSDHFMFAQKGIPVVFFCNGEHEDYHRVTDTPDKLDGAKMERVTRLAYWIGRRVADADERPALLGRRADFQATPVEEEAGAGAGTGR